MASARYGLHDVEPPVDVGHVLAQVVDLRRLAGDDLDERVRPAVALQDRVRPAHPAEPERGHDGEQQPQGGSDCCAEGDVLDDVGVEGHEAAFEWGR